MRVRDKKDPLTQPSGTRETLTKACSQQPIQEQLDLLVHYFVRFVPDFRYFVASTYYLCIEGRFGCQRR